MRHVVFALAAVAVTALLILLMVALIRFDPPPVVRKAAPVERIVLAPVEKDQSVPEIDIPPQLVAPPDLQSPLTIPVGRMKSERTRPELMPSELVSHGAIPLYAIEPVYPVEALEQAITGRVRVEFTINPDGTVSDADIVAAEPRRGIFDHAAMRALARAHFVPKKLNGVPVASRAEWTFNFIEDAERRGSTW